MEAQHFLQILQRVLRFHPAGLSEFELIKLLEIDGTAGFEADCLKDNLSLFQTHFFLFHNLYHLDRLLTEQGKWRLHISPLCIQLTAVENTCNTALAMQDPLREYYLDSDNLKNTDADEVDALLNQFWQRFLRNDERNEALQILGLQDPVDWPTIKDKHRRLAM